MILNNEVFDSLAENEHGQRTCYPDLIVSGLTQIEQISGIWTQKSGIFYIFNPLKNQRYECLNGIPRPLLGGL